jgi:sugar lactone lactonase YvrE
MSVPDRIPCELVLDAGASLGEGPIWDAASGTLLWVDINRNEIHTFDPIARGDTSAVVPNGVTAVAIRERGGLVVATRDGFAHVSISGSTAEVELIAEPEVGDAVRMNDGKCDPAGRFWAGSMSYSEKDPLGSLYVLDTDLGVRPVLSGLTISNGLGWSPPETSMYLIDSATYKVTVMDYDRVTGTASRRRDLFHTGSETEMPDGLAVDSEGCLWVAFWGGGAVRRFSPRGELLASIDVPAAQVTSCCFGGKGLTDLYITTAGEGLPGDEAKHTRAGGLFRASPGVRGLQVARFAG